MKYFNAKYESWNDEAGCRKSMARIVLYRFRLGVAWNKWELRLIGGTPVVGVVLTVGLPLEWPNAFRRRSGHGTWFRVGVACLGASLFIDRKDVSP